MDKGAHFFKSDFQVHTPRDRQWTGSVCKTEEHRIEYATELVAACRKRGLNSIAITDHHDLAFVSYVKKAAREETDPEGNPISRENQLVVFPGIELTLAVPCQAILILDADFEENRFEAVLTALSITPSANTDEKTIETVRLEAIPTFGDLKKRLDEHTWLKDRYIVLPNVSGEGKSSLLRSGMMSKYKEMPCVGGYVDGKVSSLKAGPISIISGRDKAWGNKKIGCIQTSDNRQADHGKLGESVSWIKWARPTAEALRQACLAHESRITHETPAFPASIIQSISVSNSRFLGPIELSFNAQYNALIGGRGTGKSTILEYIRWALCDQPPAANTDDAPNYQSRRSRLIDNTLKPFAATVDVSFSLNEVDHVVRRDSTTGAILLKIGKDEFRSCTEGEVRSLLPIQAYSQKQLSDVSVRVEELSRFINAPIRSQLTAIDRRINDKSEQIRQSYSVKRRHHKIVSDLSKRDLETRSLEEQAENIRKALTGLSEEDRKLIDQGRTFDRAERYVDSRIEEIRTVAQNATRLADTAEANLGQAALPSALPEVAALSDIRDVYTAVMSNAANRLRAIADSAVSVVKAIDAGDAGPWKTWNDSIEAFRAAYAAAVQRSSAHTSKMEELQQIENRIAVHQREMTQLAEQEKITASAGPDYDVERASWLAARKEYDDLLENQCKNLTDSSNGAIRAHIRRYADATAFLEKFREAVSGSNIRRERIEALGSIITGDADPAERWMTILSELETLATFDPEEDGAERRPGTPALSSSGFTPGDLDKVARKLSPDSWLALSLIEIQSQPVFEYQSRENDYIPFSNASAGQQATALLKTLLNQNGPPLLIDQPEEDLDNPVMQEIVEQIWLAKQKRQILFVSHNANLVVNGDAELVAWCDYRKAGDQSGGKIAGEGAIDIPDVREAIKRIMEGGEAAFKLRREKYGF